MPEKIPVHTVILARDSGKKDPKGEPIMQRVTPPIGKPFQFSEDEVKDIMQASPLALRDPVEESEVKKKVEEAVSQGQQAAAQAGAAMGGAAAGDAAQVAIAAAKGRGAKKNTSGNVNDEDDDVL